MCTHAVFMCVKRDACKVMLPRHTEGAAKDGYQGSILGMGLVNQRCMHARYLRDAPTTTHQAHRPLNLGSLRSLAVVRKKALLGAKPPPRRTTKGSRLVKTDHMSTPARGGRGPGGSAALACTYHHTHVGTEATTACTSFFLLLGRRAVGKLN